MQVKEQQRTWASLYEQVSKAQLSLAPITQQELYWAMSCVRSRSFSGPYIGSTLSDRLRLGGLVGLLVLFNTLTGLADLQQSLSAAIAVFVFNLMYELILSRSLKQYAMCPVVDLLNHSGATASEVAYDYFADMYRVTAMQSYKKGQQVGDGLPCSVLCALWHHCCKAPVLACSSAGMASTLRRLQRTSGAKCSLCVLE
jgi:hypothetical protein